MREKCFEIGTIQAFLDGELAPALSENVARHAAMCEDCAVLMAEAEEESAFAFAALESELNTLVPTQRLWSKINDSIGKEEKSFWQKVLAFVSNPTSIAFASMLIVFGFFIAYLSVSDNNPKNVATLPEAKQNTVVAVTKTEPANPEIRQNLSVLPVKKDLAEQKAMPSKQTQSNYQIVNANVDSNIKRKYVERNLPNQNSERDFSPKPQPAVYEYVSGEDSYIKTIAALMKSVDSRKDETLKPSSRFAFEKDLAVINDAINKMQTEVKKNPKNEAAKEVLRASYQNKIDLLSSVTEKSELMASLK